MAELKEDFPWLENLKTVLEGETLLMPGMEFRKKMKQLLDMDTKVKPPVRTVEELMNLLMSLGIIQKNTDGRINMPEIYLHGFGLQPKGWITETEIGKIIHQDDISSFGEKQWILWQYMVKK